MQDGSWSGCPRLHAFLGCPRTVCSVERARHWIHISRRLSELVETNYLKGLEILWSYICPRKPRLIKVPFLPHAPLSLLKPIRCIRDSTGELKRADSAQYDVHDTQVGKNVSVLELCLCICLIFVASPVPRTSNLSAALQAFPSATGHLVTSFPQSELAGTCFVVGA